MPPEMRGRLIRVGRSRDRAELEGDGEADQICICSSQSASMAHREGFGAALDPSGGIPSNSFKKGGKSMPEKQTLERARQDRQRGKAATTQAGEFIREEMHHIREGKHGARSTKQVIAIGLSKARRAGVELPPPKRGSWEMRKHAKRDLERGQGTPPRSKPSAKRSRAVEAALQREGRAAVSHRALSRHAHAAASQRTAEERSAAARRAAHTKGPAARSAAARRAARTRARAW